MVTTCVAAALPVQVPFVKKLYVTVPAGVPAPDTVAVSSAAAFATSVPSHGVPRPVSLTTVATEAGGTATVSDSEHAFVDGSSSESPEY
jgi:hypothetical protein